MSFSFRCGMKLNKKNEKLPKIVVICGPTASGKTEWGLRLAKKYNGEIISADSRQIYKKMDIGTAKAKGEWRRQGPRKMYFVDDVPHCLIDFLDPGERFTVAEFRDKAIECVKVISLNGHLPFIVGGTGLYIDSVVNNFNIPRVPPNSKLRKSLEEKSADELLTWLKRLDAEAAEKIDPRNKRRLIRALEVCILSGESFSSQRQKGKSMFDVLQIGIALPRQVLYDNIDKRIDGQFKAGLLEEIEALLKQKYGWELSSMSGIGYRQFKDYFAGKIDLETAVAQLKKDTRGYAKRQLTWFKRNKNIRWAETLSEADKLLADFLKK